jgi:26S proteasome regulatory subunit N5
MIQHALHQNSYLDVAKYYYKVWETPSIKEDVADKGRAVGPSCSSALYDTS